MESKVLKCVALFCPNCGHKITGHKADDGSVRLICNKCKSIIFSKKHKRKETMIKVVSSN